MAFIILTCIIGASIAYFIFRASARNGYIRTVQDYPEGANAFVRLQWEVRTRLWNFPLPANIDGWHPPDGMPFEAYYYASKEKMRGWLFLAPFFRSRGYILYVYRKPPPGEPDNHSLLPDVADPIRDEAYAETSYPFARRLYKKAADAVFDFPVSIFISPSWTYSESSKESLDLTFIEEMDCLGCTRQIRS